MQKNEDVRRLLGLGLRAGRVMIGRAAALHSIHKNHARLVIIAKDASRKIVDEVSASHPQAPVVRAMTKAELGDLINRGEVAILTVCDVNLGRTILQKISECQ